MSQRRDLKLDQYSISKERYRELYYFCLQYSEFISQKQDCYSTSSKPLDGMPRGTDMSDPTPLKAERAYRLGKNIELIEQTAIEAGGSLYSWLLKGVTQGVGWEGLNPPCGEKQYHKIRRHFFFLLSLKK